MKKYNIPNYIRYKNDLLKQLKKIEDIDIQYLNQEQLQWKFMLLVENIARKFSTTQQASGVMSINDLIQEGNLNLCKAIRLVISDVPGSIFPPWGAIIVILDPASPAEIL